MPRIELPVAPAAPPEIAELSARRSTIRKEREVIEAEIAEIQNRAWRIQQGAELEASAERLANGEASAVLREPLPEEIGVLRRRCDLLNLAEQKLSAKIATFQEAHRKAITRVYRPVHRRAVEGIHDAMVNLERANASERAICNASSGILRSYAFPNLGQRGPGNNSPISRWISAVRAIGLLDAE